MLTVVNELHRQLLGRFQNLPYTFVVLGVVNLACDDCRAEQAAEAEGFAVAVIMPAPPTAGPDHPPVLLPSAAQRW